MDFENMRGTLEGRKILCFQVFPCFYRNIEKVFSIFLNGKHRQKKEGNFTPSFRLSKRSEFANYRSPRHHDVKAEASSECIRLQKTGL